MSSLTFGPGWLRALSGGDTAEAQSKPAGMKRFKLAEFRYGREEMLALFVDNAKMPKELKDFGDIILQETLSEPLSFIPLTEEEERCQVAGVNSAVVLRMSGRGAPPVRGRGAIRGARGRGRGEGQPGYYRSLSNEDSGYNNSREPYARRPWAEGSRGGSSDRGAGRGDPSLGRGGFEPRARIPSDRAGSTEREPWRPGQEEDDGGGWRISGQRSWRKGSADASRNWRSDHSKEESGDPAIARRSWNRSNSEKEDGGNYWRHASTSSNSGLPEWCDDDDDQDLGTFDSSGQFKSLRDQKDAGQNHDKNADASDSRFSRQESDPPVFDSATDKDSEDWDGMEEAGKKQDGKTNRSSEMNDKSKINVSRDWDSGPPRGLTKEPERGSSKERSRMSPREAGQGPHNGSDQREQNQRVDTASKTSPLPEAEDSKSVPISVSELEKQLLSGNDSGKKSVNTVNSNKIDDLTIDDVKSVAHDMRKILAESHMARTVPPGNDDEEADLDMDHIKNLIDKLDDENDDPFAMQVTSPMQEVANRNIDDPSIVFAKKAEPGVLIKGMQDWIYRDPQGEIQGPFSCEEMLQWFKAGYFTMGLLVRRVCDEIFLPLGDLIKLWNRVPFLPGREPPSVTSQVYAAQLARRQQQEQYLLAQQQRKMQQQQQQQHQQIQQQQQQHELRLLQQMQEQQQMKDMQQRPHNLNVGQEVSIWGDSPAPSPNLASTPWSPSTSQPEPQAWNDSKSPTANLEEFKKHEIDKERAEKLSGLEPKKSSSEDLKRLMNEEEPAKGKPNEAEREPSDEYKGGLSPSDEELELADDDDSQLKEQNKKKSKGKKKKGANDKKKEEREKQQRREEEDRKALEALEKAQQEKIAIQKRKEEEERQKQILMQQQQLKQQQQQQILQQQQQQQQQQLKHQQMLMQQQAMMQQEQRRLNVNEGPSWNVPTSSNAPSLAEIQRMEEERQMIIREKLKQLQAHEQQIQQQQRAAAGWAEKGSKPVQSLRQIQEEEARQMLARQRNQVQHQQQPPKGGHGAVSSTVWNSKNVQSQQNYGGYDTQGGSASFWDDVMNLAPSLETSSQYQRSNSKSRVVSDSGFPSLNSGAKQNKKSKDEELVHRLFHQANPCDEFIQWVNKNMPGITKFVDVPTFVGFLQDIDSPYEVHEYIRSYFGENQDAQNFAREFLEWRKRNGRQPTSQYGPVSSSGMSIMSQNSDPAGLDGDDPTGRKKKQKKRMQKVNPSLLGFSCDADPGMVNRGAIQSAMDAWNSK